MLLHGITRKHLFVFVCDVLPAVGVPDALRGESAQLGDFRSAHAVGAVDQPGQIARLLAPIEGGILGDLAVEADVQQQVQVRGAERLEQARVGAADLMAVEVCVRVLADLHEEFLVVYGAHELDTRIPVEAGLLLELLQEPVAHIGDEREVALGPALHELADHGLVVVFRHETSDHQVVALRAEAFLRIPVKQFRVIVRQRALAGLGAVRDERGFRIVFAVLVVDVLLDVLAVTDQQVAVLGHEPFGDLPIPAYRRAPLGARPLVTVRVDVQLATELADHAMEVGCERSDAACENINNRMRDAIRSDVVDAMLQCGHVIIDGLRRANIRYLHVEAVGVVVFEGLGILGLTGHVILQQGDALMVLGQPIHEGLVSPIVTRDAL